MAKKHPSKKKTRGPKSKVPNAKLEVLTAHMDEWEEAFKTKEVSVFYTRITNILLTMFGYVPFKQDAPALCAEEDVSPDIVPTPSSSPTTEEEAAQYTELYKGTRKVCKLLYRNCITINRLLRRSRCGTTTEAPQLRRLPKPLRPPLYSRPSQARTRSRTKLPT